MTDHVQINDPVLHWLLVEGRLLPDLDAIVGELGARLLADGMPLWRLRVSMRTLHPLISAISSVWERDEQRAERIETPFGLEGRRAFVGSPIQIIVETRKPLRIRLDGPLGPEDHEVLHELKARGGTDYYGLLMRLTAVPGSTLVATSDTPGGFSDADIARLDAVGTVLAPLVDTKAAQMIAGSVAEAYLGRRTGRRVLEGQITRGDIDTIEAAILISDIRGWTNLNNEVSPETAMIKANRYFEVMDSVVERHGGEILKLLGDGVLAIFPAEGGAACDRALGAARDALAVIDGPDGPGVDFVTGLHFGEVLYGNVGARSRLDFTVLGQAVNIAARIQGACSTLDAPILLSEDFAGEVAARTREVARVPLKGIDGNVPVYVPE